MRKAKHGSRRVAWANHFARDTVRVKDGSTFCLRYKRSDAEPGAPVVLCVPAMGTPASFYERVLEALGQVGLNAAVFDLRGHGESSVRATPALDFGYEEVVALDIPGAIEATAKLFPGSPLFILGHSLGGQMACLYAAIDSKRIVGLILVACGSVYFRNWSFPWSLLALLAISIARAIAQVVGYFPGRRLGFGGREARRLIRDWSTQARTGRYIVSRSHIDFEAALASIEKPVLAISIAGDRLAPSLATQHLCSKMPRAKLDRRLVRLAPTTRKPHFDWAKQPWHVAAHVSNWIASLIPLCHNDPR